ncbi:MAG: ABC transporter ATP-binding protein [Planctomycetota bacterium]|nr:ABC transporter ATP-binding protein [Planctomycetota bacterium]
MASASQLRSIFQVPVPGRLESRSLEPPNSHLHTSMARVMPVVLCQNVSRIYEGQGARVVALEGLDLSIEAGEVLALTGPSGSGKSTLLHLLGAMDEPTSGHLEVAGQQLSGLDDVHASAFRNQQLGFIFQAFHLVPSLSAAQNVALPARLGGTPSRVAEDHARSLLDSVGIGELADRRPDHMSGGQQQRVAVARALINDPALLLADEPTGNLDHVTGGEITELLVRLGHERGVAVLVATHDPAVTVATDREIRLCDGRLDRA